MCCAAVRATPENIIVTNWNARTRPPTGLWAILRLAARNRARPPPSRRQTHVV